MRRAAAFLAFSAALFVAPTAAAQSGTGTVAGLARASNSPVSVYRSPATGATHFVRANVPTSQFSDAALPARQGTDFWAAYGALFGVRAPADELSLAKEETDGHGVTHLRYDQRYRGLAVFGRQLLLHIRNGAVLAANGHFAEGIAVATTPTVSEDGAAFVALGGIPARGGRSIVGGAELLIHVNGLDRARLAWRVLVSSAEPLGVWQVFVDAQTGEVLQAFNDLHTAKNRITHTNGNVAACNTQGAPACTLPGTQIRDEDDPPLGDAVAQDTHVNTGLVYDYYASTFGRDSYDGLGHLMRSTVHFGSGYDNAFWCGDSCITAYGSALGGQMAYGDGSWNGSTGFFSPLGQDLDVVSHELTHAVTEQENGLIYFGQSGALNESYSDVFAAMTDNDGNEWQLAEKSFTPGTPGDALRDMANPAAEGQPAHMNAYVNTWYDGGGVHTNSGIPNHAAYLAATAPGYGIGRASLQQIYYAAMPCLPNNADFLDNLLCLELAAQARLPRGRRHEGSGDQVFPGGGGIAAQPAVTAPNGGETLDGRNTGAGDLERRAAQRASGSSVSSSSRAHRRAYGEGFELGPPLPPGFTTVGPAWTVGQRQSPRRERSRPAPA